MAARKRVWFVDDREENRTAFAQNHGTVWDVRTFEDPNSLLKALGKGKHPDALLSDIYFYDNSKRREEVEKLVQDGAAELRREASKLDPQSAQEGIGLIKNVRNQFGNSPPFPIFAYTSKGPYLLADNSFDELVSLDAIWLFKNKYSPQNERHLILQAISETQALQLRSRLRAIVIKWGLLSALVGAALGVIFDHFARIWFGW